MPGLHNISNSLAVIGLGLDLKLDVKLIKKSLSSFMGVRRRFQIKHNQDDILIVDDYAHHPTEIFATINTARRFENRRIIAVFQPHRYSRMKFMLKKFSQSFFDVDHLFITDIYSAGEKKIEGISSFSLYQLMKRNNKPKTQLINKDKVIEEISSFVKKGDLLLFLGAGDISKICDALVERFKREIKV